MPFDENLAKSRKVGGLKKDVLYLNVLFILHTSVIEKGWNDGKFAQGIKQ